MKFEKTILRSKVARRIFLLFLTCSMIPIVLLTVISSRMMTNHLEEQARVRLHQTTKSIGMAMLGRLAVVEAELRALASIADPGLGLRDTERWTRITGQWHARLTGAALVSAAGVEPLFGRELPVRGLSAGDGTLPPPGSVRLMLSEGKDDGIRVLLSFVFDGRLGRPEMLVAEVDPDYLWKMDDEIELHQDTELFIFDAEKRPLLVSSDPSGRASAAIIDAHPDLLRGELRVARDGREQRGYAWPMFLKPQFGCPNWTVVVTEPLDRAVRSLAWVSKILPLTILLCLFLVTLLSMVHIRKSLIPITGLQEGTRQIAARNFDARVRVESDDEFAQLARSFNTMAHRLGTQFRTLTTMADLDRELLSTLREEQIVETLLFRAPARFHCDRSAVTLAASDGTDTVTTHVRRGTADVEERLAVLSADERGLLLEGSDRPARLPAAELPPHLAQALGDGLAECLLVPIRKNAVSGCLTLGFLSAETCTDDELTEARRLADQAGVALSNARLLERLERVNWETLYALARAVDANSPWTAGHSERVTKLALELARRLGVGEEEQLVLHRGGLLHDIGKIGVPSFILDKPGRLTDEEFAQMRDHVRIGARILEPISEYRREIPLVLYHHEWFDGAGYPEGLAGESIPFLARVMAVADVFDALVSDRPYRPGWELERVIEFMGQAAGTQFDPQVVSVFLDLVESGAWRHHLRGEQPCPMLAVEADEPKRSGARS